MTQFGILSGGFQTIQQYRKTFTFYQLQECKVTSSEAILHILSIILLAAQVRALKQRQRRQNYIVGHLLNALR